MLRTDNDILDGILRVAAEHPTANVSKCIQETHRYPTIRNIVLLLNEVGQNAEHANNFAISLKYYLDLFETLETTGEYVLNEAGLILESAAKIYDRRVDIVLDLVRAQLKSLSRANNENPIDKNENAESTVTEKPKRTRKRFVQEIKDYFDVEIELRKFRKLNDDRRFSDQAREEEQMRKLATNQCRRNFDETDYVHPATCLHSAIVDLDIEGEVDTKRNFKLFTHHVEHRYNTLVPDINFRLHFLMKDFIDGEQERLSDDEDGLTNSTETDWPPLSQAYVEKYVNLENHVLRQERDLLFPIVETAAEFDMQHFADSDTQINEKPRDSLNLTQHDSGFCSSSMESTANESTFNQLMNSTANSSTENILSSNVLDTNSQNNNDLSKTIVNMPHLNVNGVLFAHLDQAIKRMISPKVKVRDILAVLPKRENNLDNDIALEEKERATPKENSADEGRTIPKENALEPNTESCADEDILNVIAESAETTTVKENLIQLSNRSSEQPIVLNIFKFNDKLLRKEKLFKLGSEMDLFLKARAAKRPLRHASEIASKEQKSPKLFCAEGLTPVPRLIAFEKLSKNTYSDSSSECSECNGFDEEDLTCLNQDLEDELNQLTETRTSMRNCLEYISETNMLDTAASVKDNEVVAENEECIVPVLDKNSAETTTTMATIEQSIPAEEIENEKNVETENFLLADSGISLDEGFDASDEIVDNTTTSENIETIVKNIENSKDTMEKTLVQNWHERLRPFLAHARDRHHFDVFQIGTEIIDGLQTATHNAKKSAPNVVENSVYTFDDVMQNKDESYVSRYFLSSLLLINQSNIQLTVKNKNSEQPAEWSDLEFKLLSTKRHTVSIEDNIGMIPDVIEDKTKTKTKTGVKSKKVLSSTIIADDTSHSFEEFDVSTVLNDSALLSKRQSAFQHVTVDVNRIKPVAQVYKGQSRNEDIDSGVYSFGNSSYMSKEYEAIS